VPFYSMFAFGLTIFSGAFLLFLVQPLIGKFILPWFGGSPAVWTTCLLFFQVVLLGGYAYAHLSIRRLAPRQQVVLHLALLAMALLLLPITPGDQWKPPDGESPMWRIMLLLSACLGLPYLVLSATGPLMQAWFSEAHPGVSPYRLYSLSNVGSLLALAAYPFLVEPNFARHAQARWWSIGLGGFALLAAWCGAILWMRGGSTATARSDSPLGQTDANAGEHPSPTESTSTGRWLWFAMPACGSVLLMAVTNKICQDIAVIPFLWVLPLSLYLLSFVVSFDGPQWYWRPFWLPMLTLAMGSVLWITVGPSIYVPATAVLAPIRWLLQQAESLSMFKTIGIYLGTLFIGCMVCHGELYRLRPAPRKLTGYYLAIAAGGACGGVFVAVLAPLVFKDYFELHAGLFVVGVLAAVVLFVDAKSPLSHGRRAWAWVAVILALLGLGTGLYRDAAASVRDAVEVSRSFYGVLKVKEDNADDPDAHEFTLQHGGTTHGLQFVSPDKRGIPTTYYTRTSGIGRTLEHFPRQTNRRIGVVGLGTGTLAAWGKPGDTFRIYEINDEVHRLARSRFSFLGDSAATIQVVSGDARLSMEREPDQRFDILALDAFTSDAIPVHLLTLEAFEIYRRHMLPDGVIAVHISNRYLDLGPIVMRTADHLGFGAAQISDKASDRDDEEGEGGDAYASDWVLLTKNKEFLNLDAIAESTCAPAYYSPKIKMWTDEESNLFRILVLDEDGWLGWLRQLAF